MPERPVFFAAYRDLIARHGEAGIDHDDAVLEHRGGTELVYTPFETVNPKAKLVLVGITPGRTQLKSAYARAADRIAAGADDTDALVYARTAAAFDGGPMRDNLNRMLNAYHVPDLLGIDDAAQLWNEQSALLQATSLVPHAAFCNEAPFSKSFEALRENPILNRSFERDFLPSLKELPADAFVIGLGRTVDDALSWCQHHDFLNPEKVLGAIPHPSSSSGTQVRVFVGERDPADLHPKDPVRHRVPWLARTSNDLKANIGRMLDTQAWPDVPSSAPTPVHTASRQRSSHSPSSTETDSKVTANSAETIMRDAGYTCDHVTAKLARFRIGDSINGTIYVKRGTSQFTVIVHPDAIEKAEQASERLRTGAPTPTRHSNLQGVPSDLTSNQRTAYGFQIRFDTEAHLKAFLRCFENTTEFTEDPGTFFAP